MPLDDRQRRLVLEFQTWIELVGGEAPQSATITRHDREDESSFVTRWEAGRHVWYEVAIRPFLPQVRVAIRTDDRCRSRDFEQLIEEAGYTIQEFVAQGLGAAGLAWRDPPVEHYCEQGRHYYFATPLDLESIEQLADEAFREKARRILEGYRLAFAGT